MHTDLQGTQFSDSDKGNSSLIATFQFVYALHTQALSIYKHNTGKYLLVYEGIDEIFGHCDSLAEAIEIVQSEYRDLSDAGLLELY